MKKIIPLIFILTSYSLSAQKSVSMVDDNITKTIHFFNSLRSDNTHILDDFYAKDIKFYDPVGKIETLPKMKAYYKNMYEGVKSIRFDFKTNAKNDEIYFFSWKMYLQTPKLNNGEEFFVTGVSEIHFNDEGLVRYHRDYFDLGEMVYERIPVVGWIVKKVKNRLKH
tara:strand:- start:7516 stop:8016 length:501 start_codon:yes stop_codon:yes gene_type:complete